MCNYFCIYLMHFSTNKRKKWDFFSALIRAVRKGCCICRYLWNEVCRTDT